jgi:phospholipid transport system transporter-binding protein
VSNVRADEGQATVRPDGVLAVRGALTFDTVPGLWGQSTDWLANTNGPATVDLSEVRRTDSAGLALLMEWLRRAAGRGQTVKFINIPEQVRSLIRVNGLSQALNVPESP